MNEEASLRGEKIMNCQNENCFKPTIVIKKEQKVFVCPNCDES